MAIGQTSEVIISPNNEDAIGSNPDDDRESSGENEDLPPENDWIRSSFWVKTLRTARPRTTWFRVPRMYTEKTAQQIASDLRSAHHRDPKKLRVKGVLPGDRWDARWNASPEGPDGQFSIWIRFIAEDK